MGFRFRKSIKIAPGIKLNINKKSTSLSFGGKRAGVTFNSKRGTSYRISAPGTGISYTGKVSGGSEKESGYSYTDDSFDNNLESYSEGYSPDFFGTTFYRMFDPDYFIPETWLGVVGYCLRYGLLPTIVFLYLLFYVKPIWFALIYASIRFPAVDSCAGIVTDHRKRSLEIFDQSRKEAAYEKTLDSALNMKVASASSTTEEEADDEKQA